MLRIGGLLGGTISQAPRGFAENEQQTFDQSDWMLESRFLEVAHSVYFFRSSNSSSVRGQSSLNRRLSARSARSFPAVWQRAQ
jgi:hypothetical protein